MIYVCENLGLTCVYTNKLIMKGVSSISSARSKLVGLKTVILLVVLAAEIVLPYAFYLGLRAFGDSKEKMWVLQNLMVLLTSGIFLGLIVSLAKDSLGG